MANVFIGIPTINRPEFVRHAIRSALNQTYSNVEIVVSDNCSEPGVSESIVAFIAELDDQRVRFHQQSENLGEYGQGRYFFSQAQDSRYFMILHDDDVLGENYVEKAVERLEKSPKLAYFVANASIIDENGVQSDSVTRSFLKEHGRDDVAQGPIDVLENHLRSGFTLISGSLFRTEALKKSGFIDPEGVGNFPFESDIFLRLGDNRCQAWFQKEELLSFRFHTSSMRHYINFLDNEKSVNAITEQFERRQYSGYAERQRKVILSRLYRAKALISARQGQAAQCRDYIKKCFSYNLLSIKLWLLAPVAFIAPRALSWFLPELPIIQEAPALRRKETF
ncbi:MAG: glycosyltransferase family A protein [Halioglobus sp.]